MNKISVGVWTYGACSDRYVSDGYKDRLPLAERLEHLGKIDGVKGIEITYPCDINEENYPQYAPLLKKYGFEISSMGVEIVCDKQWKTGSFTSPIKEVRDNTIALVKKAMDFAAQIGTEVVSLWLGQDGYDYFMQSDYQQQWKYLIDGLRECAKHNPKIKLGLEYKTSEPRLKCMVSTGGLSLAIAQCTGMDNVGVTMDIGHALFAGENLAETATILMAQNRLFHLHINDNYRIADDDMPIGSVHFLHFIEFFYWLRKMGYEGWYSLDMYPYRDDPDAAVKASVRFIGGAERFVEKKLAGYSFEEMQKGAPSDILSNLFEKIFE
ncbi:MAG: sugar phosphate isomerase/epimerase [Ruminococcaceae bacterium]|nr:sugar phosphate isomerase/epimerase [Oscillospiraceae bacterium]